MRDSVCWGGVLLLALAAGAGCSGGKASLHKVEGVVTLDGNALEGATVSFMPEGEKGAHAGGLTDSTGHFLLRTNGKDGAQPGSYRVIVTKSSVKLDGGGGDEAAHMGGGNEKGGEIKRQYQDYLKKTQGKKPKPVLPPIYSDPEHTPFHFTVPVDGPVTLELSTKA